jgi:hypothetical protein
MRSESEANLLLLNAKKCEANSFQKIAKILRKSYKKCENFAKILNEVMRCFKARFLPKLRSAGFLNKQIFTNILLWATSSTFNGRVEPLPRKSQNS